MEVGIISPNTAVILGDAAILACVGYSQPNLEVTWTRNGAEVANSSLIYSYQEDVVQGILPFRQAFLQICAVAMGDSGAYTCVVSNGQTSANSTVQLIIAG